MNFSVEYQKIYDKHSKNQKTFDIDYWSEEAREAFYADYDDLMSKYRAYVQEQTADTEYDEEFYKIYITMDSLDGPEYEVVDIRTLPLDRLSKICIDFPQYNKYYFRKVAESL